MLMVLSTATILVADSGCSVSIGLRSEETREGLRSEETRNGIKLWIERLRINLVSRF